MIQIQKWKVPSDWQWQFTGKWILRGVRCRMQKACRVILEHVCFRCLKELLLPHQSTAVDGWPWIFIFARCSGADSFNERNLFHHITLWLRGLLRLLTWTFIVVPFFLHLPPIFPAHVFASVERCASICSLEWHLWALEWSSFLHRKAKTFPRRF